MSIQELPPPLSEIEFDKLRMNIVLLEKVIVEFDGFRALDIDEFAVEGSIDLWRQTSQL